jgi:hypothetical protein
MGKYESLASDCGKFILSSKKVAKRPKGYIIYTSGSWHRVGANAILIAFQLLEGHTFKLPPKDARRRR